MDYPARSVGMTFIPTDNPATCDTESPVAAARRQRALLEVSIGYGLILFAIWTPLPWQRVIDCAALAAVVLATVISFDGWSTMGLRISGSLHSFWMVGVALLLAAPAVVLAGKLHTLQLSGSPMMFVRRYWAYALWAFLQQFLLLDFILLRLLRLLPGRKATVTAAAGLFAVAHLPNPVLTPATLIWGFAACLFFLRYRNIYTLAAVHIIFGICIAITVPGPVDHNMRVGLSYLTYRPTGHHHRSQKDHIVSTKVWAIEDRSNPALLPGPSLSLLRLLSPIDWTEHSAQSPSSQPALAFQVASWQEPLRSEPAWRPSALPSVSSELQQSSSVPPTRASASLGQERLTVRTSPGAHAASAPRILR
jgi:membrane protease YdiL (CAAX protease family)